MAGIFLLFALIALVWGIAMLWAPLIVTGIASSMFGVFLLVITGRLAR